MYALAVRYGAPVLLLAFVACEPRGSGEVSSPPDPSDASDAVGGEAEAPERPRSTLRGEGPVEFCGQVYPPDEIAVECEEDRSIENVDVLVGLPALQVVALEGTSVRDVSVLRSLGELEDLYLSETPIESLESVAELKLQFLEISETAIVDLSPLATMKGLKVLRFTGTKISDLSPLAGLESLEEIDALDSKVADLSPLSALPALRELRVMDCPVKSIEPLRTIRSLERVDIAGTEVTSLEPLYDLPKLQYLNVDAADATMREVEAFKKARPEVEVYAVNNAG